MTLRRSIAFLTAGWLGCSPAATPRDDVAIEVRPIAQTASARAARDRSVTFAYSPEQVGEVVDEWLSETTETVGRTDAGEDRKTVRHKRHCRYEVLETRNGASVKERLVYDTYELAYDGEPEPPPPTLGKTYVASLSEGGAMTVLDEKGAAVPLLEEQWVTSSWSLGKPERYGPQLDRQTVRPRQTVKALDRIHAGRFGTKEVEAPVYVFDRNDDAVARFSYRFVSEDTARATVYDVTGKLWVSIPRGTVLREERDVAFLTGTGPTQVRGTETTRYERKRTPPPPSR